jgi:hypothetical protein
MGTPMTYISGNTGAYQSGTFNKGTIALNLNPSSLASGNNWYNGVDVTATQYLIYSDTYSTGIATQANSKPTAWTTPDLSDTSLLNLINTLPDRIGLTPFTSLPLALQWLNATNEYFLIKTNFENIVTSGLVLNLDAGWYNSYSGTTTWFDIKGGYNGTLINGPTFNGGSQGAIVFDGTDDYVNLGSIAQIAPGTGDFTIEFWINPTNWSNTYMPLLTTTVTNGIWIGKVENNFALRTYNVADDLQSTTFPTPGVWTNVIIQRSGNIATIYYNTISIVSGTVTRNYAQGTTEIARDGVTSVFNGKISTVKYYNRALSPQEILQNYNAQKSRFGIYDIVQSGLTLSYDASNYLSYPRNGSTWFDMTSNSGNGSLINGPTFNTGATPSIQFDGSDDTMRTNYNLSQFNTITINFLANAAYINESMAWSLGSGGPDWYIKENTMGYNSYGGDTYGLSTAQINQLGLRNNWHMLTMTYTQNGAIANNKVYVDGIRQTISQQLGTTRSMSFSNIGINFLSAFDNNGYSLNASVGHISVYNRELSEQEIVQNFESLRKQYPVTGYTTNGLVLNLDAGNYASYPTTGTKWVDISGNYNNGDLINSPTWSSATGGTFTFDGTDDYGSFPTNNLPSGNSEISFDCWIRWGGLFSTIYGEFVMGYGDDSGPNKVPVILINTSNQARFEFGSGSGAVISSSTISPNSWVNITATYNKSSTKIYLNGVLNGTTSYSSANITPNGSNGYNGGIGTLFSVYGNKNSPSRYGSFSGNISSVRIYNVALSDSQILQNYNALKGRFGL